MRRLLLAAAAVLAVGLPLAACAGDASVGDAAGGGPSEETTSAVATDGEPVEPGPGDEPPPWPWEAEAAGEDVPQLVSLDEIRSGGPPPDGIPPIDDPTFQPVGEASEWLTGRDPIMAVKAGGEVRGYPLAILTFHEIVNDTVGGEEIVVTYCPLCNSGLVFRRVLDGEVLSFGTSGRLWRSNLVMYDRATRTLWSQFTGEAIVGDRVGDELERLPMQIVGFDAFAEAWPGAPVLSRDTGVERPYGSNPYVGYEDSESPFLFDGETRGRLDQMDRIVAAGGEDDPVAYPWDRLAAERVVHDEIDGREVVVLWAPGAASALDSQSIAESRDVGQAGVFRAEADGQPLKLEPVVGGRFADAATGSTWTVTGAAIDGPLAGTQLERLHHDDTFWFVQFAFRPGTRVEDTSAAPANPRPAGA
ncbi:MAG: DUF3179 domain-containing protein [Euzebyales bacterium]|nr:DUF3179 domain-containing protein [Euzebyales bacterium]